MNAMEYIKTHFNATKLFLTSFISMVNSNFNMELHIQNGEGYTNYTS